jgi:teichuronic acid biosynthesis glycosyltransferase TuaG
VSYADGVSIVTPAYNAQRYIAETIASVQAQTYRHWEQIVVDDCSRDATAAKVKALAHGDSRVRLIGQQRNGGPARARQTALDAARFRWIAFLDADDLWMPQKLERQLRFMRERGSAFSYTEYRRISADGTQIGRVVRVPARMTYSRLLGNTAIATSTVIVDRESTGPLTMTETYYDDFVLWLGLLKRGFTAHALKEDLMRYRVVAKSVSRNKATSAMHVWRTYRDVERLPLARSAWSFAAYAARALLKYRTF